MSTLGGPGPSLMDCLQEKTTETSQVRDPESTSDRCDLQLSPAGSPAHLRPTGHMSSTTRQSPAQSLKSLLSLASISPNGVVRWPCGPVRPPGV